MSDLEPQQTAFLSNYFGALRAAEHSTKTFIRGARLTFQDGSLLSATAIWRDPENVWHDLAIAFHTQPDGGRKLTATDDTVQEPPTAEYLAAVKHLSEIVRSGIPVRRDHVAAATELGQDPDAASRLIIRHLNECAATHLGYPPSAAWLNHRADPEKYPNPSRGTRSF